MLPGADGCPARKNRRAAAMPPDAPIDLTALAKQIADKVADRLAGAPAKRFLSVDEASDYTSLSTDSVRSLLSSGKLTALRPVPGRILIDKKELDALMLASTHCPRKRRGVYARPEP
jgi:excisionase family DNA binding protein